MGIQTLKIGTRGSALALWQAEAVKAALLQAHAGLEVEIVVIRTSGDWSPSDGETPLPEATGGKAHFAKEIQEALLCGVIDGAVHSMKDMDSVLPEGLVIDHMLPRADARDALLFRDRGAGYGSIADLPEGFVVGTVSPRRQAFIKALRPDAQFVNLRGNVETRLSKLRGDLAREHKIDATVLAVAGLERLGLSGEIDLILEPEEMIPSAGQGAVGIERRVNDDNALAYFGQISCAETVLRVRAERACVAALGGNCHTAVGAYATLEGDGLYLRARYEGRLIERRGITTTADEAQALGAALGDAFKG